MKHTDEFRDRSIAVIGLGRAGTTVARALMAQGARVILYDSKPAEQLGEEARVLAQEGFRLALGNPEYPGIEEAEVVVPSPGVRPDAPVLVHAGERGAEVLGEIEVAYRIADAPIIAITGTNGKSTTTAMCGLMLEGAFPKVWVGGNLAPGEPICSLAQKAGPNDVIVAEVSSFQLEQTTAFRPKVAVLTNLSPDHFDRHRDMAEYATAKARIFKFQTPDDFALINAAYAKIPELNFPQVARGRHGLFSVEPLDADCGAWLEDDWLTVRCQNRVGKVASASNVPVPGRHNLENALAASLAAWLMGAKPEGIRRGLEAFQPVAHRMQPVASVEGVEYINNSMCTNPAALLASLLSYDEPVVLISGGKNKNLDFSRVGPQIGQKAKAIVLIGTAADEIAEAIGEEGATVVKASTLEEAVRQAASFAFPGDVVMLAPGCASMDMFNDFMDRGEQFVDAVNRLSSTFQVSGSE